MPKNRQVINLISAQEPKYGVEDKEYGEYGSLSGFVREGHFSITIPPNALESAIRKELIMPHILLVIFKSICLTGACLSVVGAIMVVLLIKSLVLVVPFIISGTFCYYAYRLRRIEKIKEVEEK